MKKFILLNTVLLICSLSFAQDRLHAALDTDDYETAISITDSLLNAATDSVQVKRLTINKAQYLKKLYKYDEAISAITSLSPGWLLDDVLLAQVADAQYLGGASEDALMSYVLLASRQPDNIFYSIRKMSLEYSVQDYAGAIATGHHILARDSIARVVSLMGDSFSKFEQKDSAEWYYRRNLSFNPLNKNTLLKLSSILMEKGRFAEVEQMAVAYLERRPDDASIATVAGVSQYRLKEYRDAEASFLSIYDTGDPFTVHRYLGEIYFAQTDVAAQYYLEAEDEFSRAYEADSLNVDNILKLADVKSRFTEKKRAEALELLKKAERLVLPDSTLMYRVCRGYAQNYMSAENYAAALPYFKKALDYNPGYIYALAAMGICCERTKDYRNAKLWYERYLKIASPETATARFVRQGLDFVKGELFMEEE